MKLVAAGLLAGVAPGALAAQEAPAGTPAAPAPTQAEPPLSPEEQETEIVVTAGPQRGAVQGDIPPEVQLGPADIRSYGVSSVSELLNELAPQTRSVRGRNGGGGPVVLINGRRVSGFSEIRDLPTEAIERVDILPEEVALKYGYSADQRVVNFVLRPRFRSITTELGARVATAGGRTTPTGDLGVLRINRSGRVSVNLHYDRSSALTEAERGVTGRGTAGLFDTTGNIAVAGGGEIDPGLSALVGVPVTAAGVPASAADGVPPLSAFVAGANRANATDLSPYRTLLPSGQNFTANAVVARAVSERVQASANARLELSDSSAWLGLPGVTLTLPATSPYSPFAGDTLLYRYPAGLSPLSRDTNTANAHLGFTVNGDAQQWRWSVTGNYDRNDVETFTDRGVNVSAIQSGIDAGILNPFGTLPLGLITSLPADRAHSISNTASVEGYVSGPLATLPAGKVSTSLRIGARTLSLDSDSLRNGIAQSASVSRDAASAQANVDVPLARRGQGGLGALGTLSLNGNLAIDQLSDFGTLKTTGYGLNWSPAPDVRLLVSVTDEEGAPTPQQLGNPQLVTPNVRVYDYVRGETVDITQIDGGNPNLRSDDRHVLKIGFNAKPFGSKPDLTFSADYVRSTTRNLIASFPAATAEIEAAFPDRFTRDAEGRLLRIDNRPVNFERADSEQLRWGINFSKPLKSIIQRRVEEWRANGSQGPSPLAAFRPERRNGEGEGNRGERGAGQGDGPRGDGPRGDAPRGEGRRGDGQGGGFGGRGFGGGGFGGRGGGGGRLNFSLYHTWHLKETVLIRDGLPELDLLGGSATGSRGGQPEHEIEAQAGYSNNGIGARLTANWQSGTQVRGGLGSDDTLNFSDLATVNLRLFADLGAQLNLVKDHRWLRGTRVTLSVDNVFDSRQRVTDGAGVVPLSYQPGLIDPLGRTVRISIRKLFF